MRSPGSCSPIPGASFTSYDGHRFQISPGHRRHHGLRILRKQISAEEAVWPTTRPSPLLARAQAERRSEHTSGAIMIGRQLFKLGALGAGTTTHASTFFIITGKSVRRTHIPTCMGVGSSSSRHILSIRDANDCAAGTAIAGTPTSYHICKNTHTHAPGRQVAVAPSSPSPMGHSRACRHTILH